ncbi:hypothetical protein BCR33DRAFT_782082 [Rhizoclosmatium globosum]|uniref:Uncharacterized protein n=1 Tax=Rhizoclosmatium globosum TaxID=329046 RepID=A0A1Y2CPZ0_9FUNG|nr:hypothetical protein BCR33DRAFT_782082 [Rhizoclosmatium globosum]|eukprot:ORY49101.1 hypothetical protein BCR33DRAFT_782082 [Rhizoclosmatium globosum]
MASVQPFRYLYFVSPQLDKFIFVSIGVGAYAIHERDRRRAKAKWEAANPAKAKPQRWWSGTVVPDRRDALGPL